MTTEEAKENVYRRVLVGDGFMSRNVSEVKIMEVSPTGKLVRVQYLGGIAQWLSADRVDTLLEVLP